MMKLKLVSREEGIRGRQHAKNIRQLNYFASPFQQAVGNDEEAQKNAVLFELSHSAHMGRHHMQQDLNQQIQQQNQKKGGRRGSPSARKRKNSRNKNQSQLQSEMGSSSITVFDGPATGRNATEWSQFSPQKTEPRWSRGAGQDGDDGGASRARWGDEADDEDADEIEDPYATEDLERTAIGFNAFDVELSKRRTKAQNTTSGGEDENQNDGDAGGGNQKVLSPSAAATSTGTALPLRITRGNLERKHKKQQEERHVTDFYRHLLPADVKYRARSNQSQLLREQRKHVLDKYSRRSLSGANSEPASRMDVLLTTILNSHHHTVGGNTSNSSNSNNNNVVNPNSLLHLNLHTQSRYVTQHGDRHQSLSSYGITLAEVRAMRDEFREKGDLPYLQTLQVRTAVSLGERLADGKLVRMALAKSPTGVDLTFSNLFRAVYGTGARCLPVSQINSLLAELHDEEQMRARHQPYSFRRFVTVATARDIESSFAAMLDYIQPTRRRVSQFGEQGVTEEEYCAYFMRASSVNVTAQQASKLFRQVAVPQLYEKNKKNSNFNNNHSGINSALSRRGSMRRTSMSLQSGAIGGGLGGGAGSKSFIRGMNFQNQQDGGEFGSGGTADSQPDDAEITSSDEESIPTSDDERDAEREQSGLPPVHRRRTKSTSCFNAHENNNGKEDAAKEEQPQQRQQEEPSSSAHFAHMKSEQSALIEPVHDGGDENDFEFIPKVEESRVGCSTPPPPPAPVPAQADATTPTATTPSKSHHQHHHHTPSPPRPYLTIQQQVDNERHQLPYHHNENYERPWRVEEHHHNNQNQHGATSRSNSPQPKPSLAPSAAARGRRVRRKYIITVEEWALLILPTLKLKIDELKKAHREQAAANAIFAVGGAHQNHHHGGGGGSLAVPTSGRRKSVSIDAPPEAGGGAVASSSSHLKSASPPNRAVSFVGE